MGDRIDAVGSWSDLAARFPDDTVTGGVHDIVAPGFVNTHGHFSEALLAGVAEHCTLWEWLQAVIFEINPFLTEEMAHVGTLLAGIQMLRSGITTANDMFVCSPVGGPVTPGVVRALDEIGLRGEVSFGAGDKGPASIERVMAEHDALRETADASRLTRFRVGVAALASQSDELFSRSAELAVDSGRGTHIHLQEVREEVTDTRNQYGVTPVAHCERVGTFAAPTVAAHCVWGGRVRPGDPGLQRCGRRSQPGLEHDPRLRRLPRAGVAPPRGARGHRGLTGRPATTARTSWRA